MVDYTAKAVWNMDEAVLKQIQLLKFIFIGHLHKWELESAYWTIRGIRMEVDAKLKDKEQENVEKELKELEMVRNTYLLNKTDAEKKGEYWYALEKFCILLNRLMKRHGVYFREGDDPKYAVLQR